MTQDQKKAFRKELLSLAVPLALQNLLHALVGASDALMLGRLNQASIAAVSLANQISFVMSLFTGAIVGGAGVLVAQYWGKKDYLNARRFFAMSIRYVIGISLVFSFAAVFFPAELIGLFTPDAELIRIGASYLRIVAFSYLFSSLSGCYLMMMKVDGRVRMSLIISAVTVSVDMVADIFLIYGIGKWPGLGADGSAYSTIAVEIIALTICIVESYQKDHVHPDRKSLTFFSAAFEKDLWKVVPGILAASLCWGLSLPTHAYILGHLGTDATAASSVAYLVQQLTGVLTHGLASGAGIIIGKLLGQDRFEEAKLYGKRFFRVSAISGLINIGFIAVIGPLAYVFYALEPQAKKYLVYMLLYSIPYVFGYSYNTIFTCGVLPAGGDSRYDAYSVLVATWVIAIPLSLLACFVFHWPVMAVYMIMCCDEIIKFPFLRLRFNTYIWLKNLTRNDAEITS